MAENRIDPIPESFESIEEAVSFGTPTQRQIIGMRWKKSK